MPTTIKAALKKWEEATGRKGRFHRVKMFTDLVEASTETARLLLKQWTFYNTRCFAV